MSIIYALNSDLLELKGKINLELLESYTNNVLKYELARENNFNKAFNILIVKLSKETGLSVRQVRTALKHLISTGEVTSWHDSKIRIITVVSFDKFQARDKQSDRQVTSKRQSSDKQATTDIRTYKNNKNNKKEMEAPPPDDDDIVTDFKKFCEEDDDDDW